MLYDANGSELGRIGFGSFVADGINNAVYGNNSLNRIQPIDMTSWGEVYSIDILFGGSAAIDNIYYSVVPEPAPLALLALAGGLVLLRRRQDS